MEKKIPTSAIKELGEHPSKKVIMELLENQQRNEKLVVGYGKLLKTEAKFCHYGSKRLD